MFIGTGFNDIEWPSKNESTGWAKLIRGQLTFLLVTSERIYKIKRFLAGINYVEQQVTRCQFYLNESVTRQRAPRLSSLMIQAYRPMCKQSHVVLRSPEIQRAILAKTGSYFPKKITVHYRC